MRSFLILLIVIVLLGGLLAGWLYRRANQERQAYLSVLLDPHSADAEVIAVIRKLRGETAAADERGAWLAIAASDKFSSRRRRLAIFELCDRFIRVNDSLDAAARKSGSAGWIGLCRITKVGGIAGAFPIEIAAGETVFTIELRLPDDVASCVYLRVEGSRDIADLTSALNLHSSPSGGSCITAIALVTEDPIGQSLVQRFR